MQILHSMSSGTEETKGIDRKTVARVWGFSKPYRPMVVGFIILIVLGTVIGLVPTLAFGDIIDNAIPIGQETGDRSRLNWLGLIIVGAALMSAAISMIERWLSSRIGEGIIYDLRDRLPASERSTAGAGRWGIPTHHRSVGAVRRQSGIRHYFRR